MRTYTNHHSNIPHKPPPATTTTDKPTPNRTNPPNTRQVPIASSSIEREDTSSHEVRDGTSPFMIQTLNHLPATKAGNRDRKLESQHHPNHHLPHELWVQVLRHDRAHGVHAALLDVSCGTSRRPFSDAKMKVKSSCMKGTWKSSLET